MGPEHRNPLPDGECEEQPETEQDIYYFDHDTCDIAPAASLPGWNWHEWSDGSGHLQSPEGKCYFQYELDTHEYRSPTDDRYTFMAGYPYDVEPFHTFKQKAERRIAHLLHIEGYTEVPPGPERRDNMNEISLRIHNDGEGTLSQEVHDNPIRWTRRFPEHGEMKTEDERVIAPEDMVTLLNYYTFCQEHELPLLSGIEEIRDRLQEALSGYIDELGDAMDYVTIEEDKESLQETMDEVEALVELLQPGPGPERPQVQAL